MKAKGLVTQSCPALCDPMNCSPPGSRPWESPGKNTGVDFHALLQGIFPTQRLNPDLLHFRHILYCLSHQGSPRTPKVKWLVKSQTNTTFPSLRYNMLFTTQALRGRKPLLWNKKSSSPHTHTHTHTHTEAQVLCSDFQICWNGPQNTCMYSPTLTHHFPNLTLFCHDAH